jgi:hypothetical protein
MIACRSTHCLTLSCPHMLPPYLAALSNLYRERGCIGCHDAAGSKYLRFVEDGQGTTGGSARELRRFPALRHRARRPAKSWSSVGRWQGQQSRLATAPAGLHGRRRKWHRGRTPWARTVLSACHGPHGHDTRGPRPVPVRVRPVCQK